MNPADRSNPTNLSRTPGDAGQAHEEHSGFELSPADQAALDALFDGETGSIVTGDPFAALIARTAAHSNATPQGHDDRVSRCVMLLGQLGCGPVPPVQDTLIDATLVRAAQMRRLDRDDLTPMDEDALEALVTAGFDPERCPGGVRNRAERHAKVLGALSVDVSAQEREALVAGTLSFVQARIDHATTRRTIAHQSAEAARWRPTVRWGDLVSVAALLFIAGAVLTPMVGAMRGVAQATSCQAGMFGTMRGFAAYANDFREMLPMASASSAGRSWWNIGTPEESNSANLFTMVRASYAKTADLACPGNARACRSEDRAKAADWSCSDEISYSYQNMFAAERPRWTQPQTVVVLADRSPVTVRAMRGEWFNPIANSDNHMQRGQNALLNDGSIHWLRTPVVPRGLTGGWHDGMQVDNIWLPQPLETAIARFQSPTQAGPLHGTESPAGATDVFLSP